MLPGPRSTSFVEHHDRRKSFVCFVKEIDYCTAKLVINGDGRRHLLSGKEA